MKIQGFSLVNVVFYFTQILLDGTSRETELTLAVDPRETWGSDDKKRAAVAMFKNITRFGSWSDMAGVVLNKAVIRTGRAGEFSPVTNLDERGVERDYRVTLAATLDGRSRPYNHREAVRATSGTAAKLAVWESFKGSLGDKFCDMAATMNGLTVSVEVENTAEEVIYERPNAGSIGGETEITRGKVAATLSADKRTASVTITGINANEANDLYRAVSGEDEIGSDLESVASHLDDVMEGYEDEDND